MRDLDLYAVGDHSACRVGEFCRATGKPGLCRGQHRMGPGDVPPAPAPVDPRAVAAETGKQTALRQAMLQAQAHADLLGVGDKSAPHLKGAVADYGRALHRRQQTQAALERVRAGQQRAHDTVQAALERQKAADAHAAAVAAERAKRKALHDAAKHHRKQKATPKPLVFATDLYAPALERDLYALVASSHVLCNLSRFCHNPLHPGPCKGWKHTLKQVAPELHRRLEEERVNRVRTRRAERIKDLEGRGEKVPAHLRRKLKHEVDKPAKEVPEKAGPERKAGRHLSAETMALVADARKQLPKSREEWDGLTLQKVPGQRRIDIRLKDAEDELAGATKNREAMAELLDHMEKQTTDDLKRMGIRRNTNRWKAVMGAKTDHIRKDLDEAERQEIMARSGHDYLKGIAAMSEEEMRAKLHPRDVEAWLERETTDRLTYEMDKSGLPMPPAALREHHERVMKAGEAIMGDVSKAMNTDPRAQAAADKLRAARSLTDRLFAEREYRTVQQQIIKEALADVRPMGGARHDAIAHPGGGLANAAPPPQGWQEAVRVADGMFPDDWVRSSSKDKLSIGGSARAYYSATGGDRFTPMLALDGVELHYYSGAFDRYSHEVATHEMGHRMEDVVPGLKALQFAYVRSKLIRQPDGSLERPVKLAEQYGGAYRPDETAFLDHFRNAYTGKTYEDIGSPVKSFNRPDGLHWEAFQVGLQDLYGRSSHQYGQDDLQHLVAGAMATLGYQEEG